MRTIIHLLLIPLSVLWTESSAQTTFVDVQATVGLNFQHETDTICPNPPLGSGSAWADYDNDGDIDLYLTSMGSVSRLYQNQGDTNGDKLPDFVDVAVSVGVAIDSWTSGVVFIDYDNDADQDLYVNRWGGNHLFQNQLIENGSATFVDVTSIAGVGDADRAMTAAWADFDQDGWLDLYLAKHFDCMPNIRETRDALFRNNTDGTFTNVSHYLCADATLECPQLNESLAGAAGWFDYDNDGDPDLYVPGDVVASGYGNILWRNDGSDGIGGWVFTDVTEESGSNFSINCKGLGIGDYENDGIFDIAFDHSEGGFLLRGTGQGTFEDVSYEAGVRRIYTPDGDLATTRGALFFDYDNDGWSDLFYVAGMISTNPTPQPDALFRNDHDGTFTDVSAESGVDDDRRGRSASICDFNQDGFVDLFVGNFGVPIDLFYNQGSALSNTNHWLTLIPEGTVSNRDGIGARLSLTTPDGVTQIREIISGQTSGGGEHKVAHFGMGANQTGELTIRWPSGIVDNLGSVSADQHLRVVEGITSVSQDNSVPAYFQLFQNYPNPFNPSTNIKYALATRTHARLVVSDIIGRNVAILVDGVQESGHHSVSFDGTYLASGIYFYRLEADGFTNTKKLVLMK